MPGDMEMVEEGCKNWLLQGQRAGKHSAEDPAGHLQWLFKHGNKHSQESHGFKLLPERDEDIFCPR